MKRPIIHVVLPVVIVCLFINCAGSPNCPRPDLPTTAESKNDEERAVAEPEAVSEATPQESPPSETSQEPANKQVPIPPPVFDPSSVTIEAKTAAITDIRALIDDLNQVIRRKDYISWLSHLTPEYVAYYSEPARLAKYSESPVLKNQGIFLYTLKDYFDYIVYPSHQNDRVDDINFVNEDLVKAITVSPKGSRDILYILEKHGDIWKIGIGR